MEEQRIQEPSDETYPQLAWRLLVTDLWNSPLTAKSRTSEKLGSIDFAMVVPPARAYLWYAFFPPLAYPIAALHLFGYVRCVRTMTAPHSYRQERYEDNKIFYGVQRRDYDKRLRRLTESVVADIDETRRALEVTNGIRNQFVDDPEKPGVAYFVVEQRVIRTEAIFLAENWLYAAMADVMKYCVPAALAHLFHKPAQRFVIDVRLWTQGRLHWRQIRHPVANFFTTYREYTHNMRRINVVQPKASAVKPVNPWSQR